MQKFYILLINDEVLICDSKNGGVCLSSGSFMYKEDAKILATILSKETGWEIKNETKL